MFSTLERLFVLVDSMKRTNNAFRDVLRLIEKEDLGVAGWDSSADVRWERVRSCQALLPSAARMRWETFYVRESDYKACCKLLTSVSRVHEMLCTEDTLSTFYVSAAAQANSSMSADVIAQAIASLMPPESDFVRNCSAFADIAGDDQILLQMIVRALRPVLFSDGQIILREGTVATSMYLIKRGTCEVRVEGRTIGKLTDGELVGDAEIVRSALRWADVVAVGNCELLQLTRADLNELLIWHPALRLHLQEHSQARLDAFAAVRQELGLPALPGAARSPGGRADDGDDEWDGLTVANSSLPPADPDGPVLKALRDLVLGSEAPAAQLRPRLRVAGSAGAPPPPRRGSQDSHAEGAWARVAAAMRRVAVPAGRAIITAGTVGRCMYVVEEGRAHVVVEGSVVSELSSGALVGEVCLLMMGRRMADVVASTDCTLLQARPVCVSARATSRCSRRGPCSPAPAHGRQHESAVR
jgi:CRP-like cAMP-binding protein